ncbi:hypothetical protein ABPG73_021279 [Tetrahymena malaccensis]
MKVNIFNFLQIHYLISVVLCYANEIQYQENNAKKCDSVLVDQFKNQGIHFECISGQIVVSNSNEITLSLDLIGKKITTSVIFQNITKLYWDQFQILNCSLDLKYFISLKSIQEFNINSIKINIIQQKELSAMQLIKTDKVKQINIDSINLEYTYLIQLNAHNIKINNLQSLSISYLDVFGENLIQIGKLLIKEVQTKDFQMTLKLLSNSNIEIRQFIVLSVSSNNIQNQITKNIKSVNRDSQSNMEIISIAINLKDNTQQKILIKCLQFQIQREIFYKSQVLFEVKYDYDSEQLLSSYNNLLLQIEQIDYQIFNSESFFKILITNIEKVKIGTVYIEGYNPQPIQQQQQQQQYDFLIEASSVRNLTISSIQIKENSFISQGVVIGIAFSFTVINQIDIKTGCRFQSPLLKITASDILIKSVNIERAIFDSYLIYIPESNYARMKALYLSGVQFQQESLFYYDEVIQAIFNKVTIQNLFQGNQVDQIFQQKEQQKFIIKIQQLRSSLYFKDLFIDMKQTQNLSFLFLKQGKPSVQYPFYKLETQNAYIKNGHSLNFGGCFQLHNLKNSSKKQINLIFKNTTFDSCVSKYLGGAISGGSLTKAKDLKIINCRSKIGGGLYIQQQKSNKTELQKINFQNNKAYLTGNDYSFEIQDIIINKIEELNLNLQYPYTIVETDKFLYQGLTYVISLSFKINNTIFSQFGRDSSFGNMYNFLLNKNDNYLQDTPNELSNYYSPYFIWVVEDTDFQGKQQAAINFKSILFNIKYTFNTSNYQLLNGCKKQGMERIEVQKGGKHTFICRYCQQNMANYDQSQCQTCSFHQFQKCFANYSLLQDSFWRLNYTVDSDQIYKCSLNPSSCVADLQQIIFQINHQIIKEVELVILFVMKATLEHNAQIVILMEFIGAKDIQYKEIFSAQNAALPHQI